MSLVRSDSKASRHIVFSFPVSRYALNRGVSENLSLKTFLRATVNDFNQMATAGICDKDGQDPQTLLALHNFIRTQPFAVLFQTERVHFEWRPKKTLYFHIVSLKGDLKFLGQALSLTRHPGCEEAWSTKPFAPKKMFVCLCPLKVCFRCPATMRRKDFSMVYTNISGGWQDSELEEPPWIAEPALCQLHGFSMRRVSLDWMHCFNLGVCRDLTGSCLKILLKNRQYFEGSNLDARFATFNRELRAFLKPEGLHMHLKYFKKSNLIWKNDACPELLRSASDATAVLRFLSQKLAQKPSPFPFEGLSACMWVAEQLNATILRSNVFMTEPEVQAVDALGSSFLRMYLSLANKAQEQNALLFKLRPKFHFVQHLLLDATARPSRRSLGWDANFMDEDYVKQCLRILRGLHPSTAAHNVLKRQVTQLKFAVAHYRERLA